MKIYSTILILMGVVILTGCQNNLTLSSAKDPIKKVFITKEKKICNKYKKKMSYAFSYIVDEFHQGYFINDDLLGAKAQLFLIKNRATSLFAMNINNAKKSYNNNYKLAKNEKCNLDKFKKNPLFTVNHKVQKLENSKQKQ